MPKKPEFSFTDAYIKSLKPRENKKDYIVFDAKMQGLGIRVTQHSKIFIVRYKDPVNFCKKQESLGAYGNLTIAQARDALNVKLGKVALGRSPYEEAKIAKEQKRIEEQKERLTLDVLLTEWDADNADELKLSYRKEVLRQLKKHLAEYLNAPAENMKKENIDKIVNALKKSKGIGARNLCAYGRAIYNWALSKEYCSHNPFINVVKGEAQSRERWLDDKELAVVYTCAENTAYPFGEFVCLLALTGQRRNEVAGMKWNEISDDLSTWTIPRERSKNSKSHIVHLSSQTQKILKKIKKIRLFPKSDFVFTTNGKTPISGFSKAKNTLDKACEKVLGKTRQIPNWTFHDFRRTISSNLAKKKFQYIVADKILNHSEGGLRGVSKTYQRYDYGEERVTALNLWGAHVEEIARSMRLSLKKASKKKAAG